MSLSAFNWKKFSPRWEFANRQMSSHGNNSVIIVRWFVVVDYESFVRKVVHTLLHLAHYLLRIVNFWWMMFGACSHFCLTNCLSFRISLHSIKIFPCRSLSKETLSGASKRLRGRIGSQMLQEMEFLRKNVNSLATLARTHSKPLKTNKRDDKSWRNENANWFAENKTWKRVIVSSLFAPSPPFGDDDLIIFQ